MTEAESIKYVRTRDGVSIAYVDEGEGVPIVVIPPWVSHLGIPFPPRELPPGVRSITYDKRACGLSDRDVEDLSFEARMLDLEAVLDAVSVERFVLIAASEAGPLAIAYAAAHPERVSRMVLGGTFANGAELPREVYEAITAVVRADWRLACETLSMMFAPRVPAVVRRSLPDVRQPGGRGADVEHDPLDRRDRRPRFHHLPGASDPRDR